MSTDAEWPHESFADWLDAARRRAGIKNDLALAKLAGLNHSSLSAWKSGRQRPTTGSLSKIAQILKVSAAEAWAEAGYLTEADEPPVTAPEDPAIRLIRESGLSPKIIDHLIKKELEDRERRVRESIELARATSTAPSD